MIRFWRGGRSGPAAANLAGANLKGADLRGVDLRFVRGLTAEQVRQATVDDSTRLPPEVQLDLAILDPDRHRTEG